MKFFYRFGERPLPALDEVGGKGLSLIRLFQAGFPVPAGFVLTTAFFEPWIVLLKATPAWKQFLAADQAGLRDVCQRDERPAKAEDPRVEQDGCIHRPADVDAEGREHKVRQDHVCDTQRDHDQEVRDQE